MDTEIRTDRQTTEQRTNDEQPDLGTDSRATDSTPRRRINPVVFVIAVSVMLAVGIGWYLYSRGFEDTDDAQVDGHLNPIAARVDGTIRAVYADDNQIMETGKPLIELDPRDYQVAFDQAKAQHDQANAQLGAAHPNLPITRIANRTDLTSQQAEVINAEASLAAARHDLDTAMAKLKESQAIGDRNQADFLRYRTLYEENEVSRADYDQFKATASAQAQAIAANRATLASAQQTVKQRQAQLEQQRSKLEQTQGNAPLQVAIREANIKDQQANAEATGAVLERAEVGARISAGQQLLMIVQTDDLWVTANFKETQLARMHPGQRVRIYVDALHDSFNGTVESMPAITGSRTSVLPPENATGNYVKVIQRMPVRIRFKPNQKDLDKLRPGMSVEPKVYLD
jgi:membrane fusion protein (multidrug efflux system)